MERQQDFNLLKDYMTHVKLIVCYGENKKRIKEFGDKLMIETEVVNNLSEAVNKAYEFASKICECCVFANLTDVNKDYEKRLSYLQDAKKYLKCLSMQMNLISHYENKVTDNQWIKFTNDTDKLEKLINGVIKSDKSRQETLGV